MSGAQKRKFAEVDREEEEEEEDPRYPSSPSGSLSSSSSSSSSSSEWESDGDSSSGNNQDFTPSIPTSPFTSLPIRPILKTKPGWSPTTIRPGANGNAVRFHLVTVFLFPRCQSFTGVPGRGGATLGMTRRHAALRRFTLEEHALERHARRRERLRERLRQERLENRRNNLAANGDSAEEEPVPDEDFDDVHIGDAELAEEGGGFLLPYSSKQRQALLRAAGVKRIDREEKRQLHALRRSRDDCGCDCRGFCEPETCACSLAGIKCQMDRSGFPCGCSADCCSNPTGRVQFDSRRVQTHYLHTAMRLELERRLQGGDAPDRRPLPPEERPGVREDQNHQDQNRQRPPTVQEKSCPFGFTAEDDGLSLTLPSVPAFHFSPALAMAGESSYGSDATDSSSCSSSSATSEDSEDAAGSPQVCHRNLPEEEEEEEEDGGLARMLDLCDWESEEGEVGGDGGEARDGGRRPYRRCYGGSYADADNSLGSSSSLAEYLDENANEATDLFADSPLQEYPDTPSPSIDHSASYMDLSLSSESDFEFFDSFPDFSGSGPLHNSFKGHGFQHLRLLSPPSVPKYDDQHGTCLLESLIGLSEPIPEPLSPFTDNQLFEMVQ